MLIFNVKPAFFLCGKFALLALLYLRGVGGLHITPCFLRI